MAEEGGQHGRNQLKSVAVCSRLNGWSLAGGEGVPSSSSGLSFLDC